MIFTKRLRDGVRSGQIPCSVRIWRRPHVTVGCRYRMEDGEIEVDSIFPISLPDITPELARASGFKGVVDLLKVAKHGKGENVYLVRFHYVPPATELLATGTSGRRRAARSRSLCAVLGGPRGGGAVTDEAVGRPPIISATFRCKACGAEAETLQLVPKGVQHMYQLAYGDQLGTIVFDCGSTAMPLSGEDYSRIKSALLSGKASALHALHPRWVAMYCPACDECYCKRHWAIDETPDPLSDSWSMHYDTYGRCPAGHRRLMAKDSMNWP